MSATRADGALSVRVARTVAEVEGLRPVWESLQGQRFTSDIDVVLTVVRHAPGVLRPHVVVVEERGKPVTLVVARLEDVVLRAHLGYVGVSPRLRMLTVFYGGILGAVPEAAALVSALRRSLGGEQVDLVRLRMLPVGSPLHAETRGHAGILRRRRFERALLHWRCAVPDSVEEFLATRSRERRRHIRRYQRRLEDAFAGDVNVRSFTSREGLDRLFADSERVQQRTYQRSLGVGFTDNELTRELTGLAMDKGWFQGVVLYLRDEPAAFWHGSAYRGTFGTSVTAYDPALAGHRPGTYLFMRLVERLCADPTVHTLDFGFGDADYKRSFGDSCVLEEDVVVFEPRPRPLAVNAVESTLLGTATLGRAALARTGGVAATRRAWRRRLARSRSDA